MESCKLRRTGIRSSFTKTCNLLKQELAKEELEVGLIKDKFTKLQNLQLELKELDEKFLDFLSVEKSISEDGISKEMDGREVYSDEFITLTRIINEKLAISEERVSDYGSNCGSVSGNKTKSYKLPKIELKKFDGEFINWLPFWSQFEKIHNDTDLHDSDKFAYLVQSMKLGSRAKEFIESYPVTSECYDKAVSALKERFGKPELLIEVYVRELIKLIISNVKVENKDKSPLDKLFDKIEAQLRALESLGLKSSENSSWLYPMVESCLSEEILRAWQRSSLFNEPGEAESSRLNNLMKFLRAEVEGEERLKLARTGFENVNVKNRYYDKSREEVKEKFKFKKHPNIPTAANFFTAKENLCIFCDRPHESKNCYAARLISLEEKIAKIKDKKLCLRCLQPNHLARVCKQFVRCQACGKQHLICLCPKLNNIKSEISTNKEVGEVVNTATAGPICTSEVTLMTLRVRVAGVNKTKTIRVLLDCGSQKSYILTSLATELNLPIISRETIAHTLFGGARTEPKLHNKYRVKLCSSSPHKCPELEFEVLNQDVICGEIPRVAKGPIVKELKRNNIWLSDMGPDCPKIEMLIGSDIYGKILTGLVKQLRGGLTAIYTKLGWAVCGALEGLVSPKEENSATLCASLAVRNFKLSDLWNLETIGISGSQQNLTKVAEEEMAHEQFLNSLAKNKEGRYSVGLPWLGKDVELPSNRHVAEKRLFSVTRKLKTLNKYEEYAKIFREWMDEGVIEVVPKEEHDSKGHYLPHHPVFKPDSLTTKVRPVFDASCKVGRSPSLNDCLFKGPNLIEEIPSILLRFREKRIGVTSDIRRAFLQIELKEEDRDFLRFLWWDEENVIKVLRHTRVVFGVTSSPFLLGAVIAFHLSQVPMEKRTIAQKLAKSFYIDNCLTSVDDEEELVEFIKYSIEVLAEAKMDLRMWGFGSVGINYNLIPKEFCTEPTLENPMTVLGVVWDRKTDNLSICIKTVKISENLTKRIVLSLTQTIFDPLGFLTPVLLSAKLMIQEIWTMKVDWDDPLPQNVKTKFVKWYQNLKILNESKIPRRIGYGDKSCWSLHIFCDASRQAYATVIYLRCACRDETFVSLVAAKARVAPLKELTIPRLELMSCVLGARFSKYISEALALGDCPRYFWTDSTTALSWIKRNDLWGTFVGNRVREICNVTNVNQWHYVPGQSNPADLPSRGCSPQQFVQLDWWLGPSWLKDPIDSWPKLETTPDESLILSERRKGVKLNVNINVSVNVKEFKWYEKCRYGMCSSTHN